MAIGLYCIDMNEMNMFENLIHLKKQAFFLDQLAEPFSAF